MTECRVTRGRRDSGARQARRPQTEVPHAPQGIPPLPLNMASRLPAPRPARIAPRLNFLASARLHFIPGQSILGEHAPRIVAERAVLKIGAADVAELADALGSGPSSP